MEINDNYLKYIESKVSPYCILRSINASSNILAAIYRIFYLKNNYCLYDNDKILYLTNKHKNIDNISRVYNGLKSQIDLNYITLFSFGKDKVKFLTIDEIRDGYFKEYNSENNWMLKRIDREEQRDVLVKSCLDIIKNEYIGLKLLNSEYMGFFADEINWMKALEYTKLDEYQNCIRSGRKYTKGKGPFRLLKNSKERDATYRLFTVYEDKLKINNLVDDNDVDRIALQQAQKKSIMEYTHIFVDECESYAKKQLQLINSLRNEKSYGSLNYIYNKKTSLPIGAYITKLSKISELNNGQKVKNYYFRKPFNHSMISLLEAEENAQNMGESLNKEIPIGNDSTIENYEFISIKYGREFKFSRDINQSNSIMLISDDENEEIGAEEMKELPLFSNIAAGEPILMNPEVEDTFYLPKIWIKGLENYFMLRVKGDSMIGAGIDDGDYVVLKSGTTVQNRDIVAVDLDGSATLKRLLLKKDSAILMPENEKYKPIAIGEEAHFLGTAVGIIKKK